MTISKVTDPTKIVTDRLVLKRLIEQKIDPKFVELWHDYAPRSKGKEYSPYSKFYRDLKSGNRIMVVSGLPMVKVLGRRIEVGWLYAKRRYYSKANLFSAIVKGNQIQVTALSDQPTGAKKGNQAIWEPRLFLNNKEQTCGEAKLLKTDPINQFYHQNTLEWDYGICKRRVRVIEGRIRDRWYFHADPKGEIRVANNSSGNLPLRFGSRDADGMPIGRVEGNVEIISKEELANALYPIQIGGSPETFYPDAHVETSSVDGYVHHVLADGLLWATLVGAAGNGGNDDETTIRSPYWRCDTDANYWDYIQRGIILFDTAGLPDTCTIIAATLSLYGNSTDDTVAPNINIYSSNPASNTALTGTDYATLGSDAYCDTPVAFGDWKTNDYNDWALNADPGLLAISKTSVSKFGTRNATYDAGATAPAWSSGAISGLKSYSAEQGAGYKPKLVVTYTVAGDIPVQSMDYHLQGVR